MSCVVLFFCKQKKAYEMLISDWSSDVCSSDLQPEEKRCIRAGYPSRRANLALRRQDTHAFDTGRRYLHNLGVLVARAYAGALECTVLLRRYLFTDYRSGDHGFHGAGSGLHDVSPIRLAAQEGQLKGCGIAIAVREWKKTKSYKCKVRFLRTFPTQLVASSWKMAM